MEFKIGERYFPVILTRRSRLCKAKQFLKRFGNIKITGTIKQIEKFFSSRQLHVQS